MSVKDVTKQLRAVFAKDSKEEVGLEVPPEVLGSIHAFLAQVEDADFSPEDSSKLFDSLVEIAQSIAETPSKRSAGLLALAELLNLDHSRWLSRPTFAQADALWKTILRPALAPALAPAKDKWEPLSRNAATAVKKIAAWILEPDSGSDDCELERVVLQDYCDLSQGAPTSQLSADRSLLQLKELLASSGRMRPKTFFKTLSNFIPLHAASRPALLDLIAFFLRQHANLAHHVISSGILKQLMTCFLVEVDPITIQSALACILVILPRITVALPQFLPDFMACYAKVAALHHRQRIRERNAASLIDESLLFDTGEESASPGDTRLPALSPSLEWVQSRPQSSKLDYAHLPARELFTFLYGLLPCNLAAFLRHPDQYLSEHEWQSPFASGYDEPSLDLRLTAVNSSTFLKMHAMQESIIISSPKQEIADLKRTWERYDAAGVIDECEKLYLMRIAADVPRMGSKEALSPHFPQPPRLAELASPATRHEELPTPSPVAPNLALPDLEVANVQASTVPLSRDPSVDSTTQRLLALKDREILLLRSELQHELYLKAQHVQHMGTLHRQKVLDSGYEADRQALMNQVKFYRAQLTERQALLEKQKNEAATARSAHVKWENELRTKNRSLKDERRAWRQESDKFNAKLETMQAQLSAQTKELEDQGAKNFDLTAELARTSEKAKKAGQYEEELRRVTTSMLLWDQDIKKMKQQEEQIEKLVSDWRKASELAEASEAEVEALKTRLQAMDEEAVGFKRRLAELEDQVASAPRSVLPSQTLQRQTSSEKLREECNKMRLHMNQLEEEVFELRVASESHEPELQTAVPVSA